MTHDEYYAFARKSREDLKKRLAEQYPELGTPTITGDELRGIAQSLGSPSPGSVTSHVDRILGRGRSASISKYDITTPMKASGSGLPDPGPSNPGVPDPGVSQGVTVPAADIGRTTTPEGSNGNRRFIVDSWSSQDGKTPNGKERDHST
jgi:hypothetical protein